MSDVVPKVDRDDRFTAESNSFLLQLMGVI